MSTTSITVRMDTNLKKQVETLFDDMGLTMTTAITLFAKAVVRQNKIPFEIAADPFYGESNMARLTTAPPIQTRESVLTRGLAAMYEAHDQAALNGTSDMTLADINDIIAECRQENRGA